MTYNKQLLTRLQEIFHSKLQSKTGWSKNEVIQLHTKSINEAVLGLIDDRT